MRFAGLLARRRDPHFSGVATTMPLRWRAQRRAWRMALVAIASVACLGAAPDMLAAQQVEQTSIKGEFVDLPGPPPKRVWRETVTFRNDTGRAVRVTLDVSSDNVVLRDPAASGIAVRALRRRIDVRGRVEQSKIVVETRGPGSFSLLVRMRAGNGYELSGDRYTLRSTLVGALGKVLTIGALTFLAMWWTRSILRSHRRKAAGKHPSKTSVRP